MSTIQIPQGYHSPLNTKETEIAIKKVKDFFVSFLLLRAYLSPKDQNEL